MKRPDDDTIRDLCRRMTAREIAKQYGVTQTTVRKWTKLAGCRPRKAVVGPDWRRGPNVRTPENRVRFWRWQRGERA